MIWQEDSKSRATSLNHETCCTDSVKFVQSNKFYLYRNSNSELFPSCSTLVSETLTEEKMGSWLQIWATSLGWEDQILVCGPVTSYYTFCYICVYAHTDPKWAISVYTTYMQCRQYGAEQGFGSSWFLFLDESSSQKATQKSRFPIKEKWTYLLMQQATKDM